MWVSLFLQVGDGEGNEDGEVNGDDEGYKKKKEEKKWWVGRCQKLWLRGGVSLREDENGEKRGCWWEVGVNGFLAEVTNILILNCLSILILLKIIW